MKTYTYEGIELVESGETRETKHGEYFLSESGHVGREGFGWAAWAPRKILIPKEQKVSEGQDEYQIPVLVKADAKRSGADRCPLYRGKVIMCQLSGGLYYGPHKGVNGVTPNWFEDDLIPYPTQAQVEAERAKLAPKPDTLPAPVREALQAADLGCRREGVEKLIEAMYANPPKGSQE